MKRKGPYFPGSVLLKWHTIGFTVFTVALWMSVLATFDYPGNVSVPFAAFKPFLVERMQLNIIWGLLLLGHFTIHQFQILLHLHEQVAQLMALAPIQDFLARRRLEEVLPEGDAQLVHEELLSPPPGLLNQPDLIMRRGEPGWLRPGDCDLHIRGGIDPTAAEAGP